MASPHYRLTYFDGPGMGEPVRWIFLVAGVDFEDVRVKWGSDVWKDEIKATTPFGQLPVLEMDDVKLSQSKAICRYLARQFGLVGETELEQARGDMMVDCVDDMRAPVVKIIYEQDEERKKKAGLMYQDEQLPTFLAMFEKLLKDNETGSGYFVGNKLTWSDIYFTTHLNLIKGVLALNKLTVPLDKYTSILALSEKVQSIPAIADWLQKHQRKPAS